MYDPVDNLAGFYLGCWSATKSTGSLSEGYSGNAASRDECAALCTVPDKREFSYFAHKVESTDCPKGTEHVTDEAECQKQAAGTTGKCDDQLIPSASCTASSEYDSSWGCENAFNGNDEKQWKTRDETTGAWVKSKFSGRFQVRRFEYRQRPLYFEYNKGITLTFSDGSIQSFTLQKTNEVQSFAVRPVLTDSVKITVTSIYGFNFKGGRSGMWKDARAAGARTIRFHGCAGKKWSSSGTWSDHMPGCFEGSQNGRGNGAIHFNKGGAFSAPKGFAVCRKRGWCQPCDVPDVASAHSLPHVPTLRSLPETTCNVEWEAV